MIWVRVGKRLRAEVYRYPAKCCAGKKVNYFGPERPVKVDARRVDLINEAMHYSIAFRPLGGGWCIIPIKCALYRL